ncbi:hypothetical protein AVEN_9520-1 [Araneus ventricosus]|uniref:Uncharacterized protein n=1 Tax=Araneus ventricosus TaxID=182803 RepID=A0A4Y2CLU8_ARAVE|nr:hypothetical protein AVEN_9520-1 [Araneus ventricosus]
MVVVSHTRHNARTLDAKDSSDRATCTVINGVNETLAGWACIKLLLPVRSFHHLSLLWICELPCRIDGVNCLQDIFRHQASSCHIVLRHFCVFMGALLNIRPVFLDLQCIYCNSIRNKTLINFNVSPPFI